MVPPNGANPASVIADHGARKVVGTDKRDGRSSKPPSKISQGRNPPTVEPDDELRSFLLKILRLGSLRARLIATEFDTVGVALKSSWMTPAAALEALEEVSACQLPVWDFIPEIEVRP
jgi:hypothetical protein